MDKQQLVKFLQERKRQKPFLIEDYCFDRQLAFIQDTARYKTAVCSRRSGKTVSCAADLVHTAQTFPNSVCLYITLSRINAKKIVWREIIKILKAHDISHKLDNTELSIELMNGSIIYLSGAKDKSEIEKFRGLAIKKCYIDESQSFKSYIEELIDDVITPALFDNNGTLCLIGTPAPVPAGYFHDCAHNDNWSNHSWTLFDNPFIKVKSGKEGKELLDEELKRRGVSLDDAKIQREFFAKWTVDGDSLVFRFNDWNYYSDITVDNNWTYCIGVDIGYDDADAIAVLGWHKHRKEVYLFEECLVHQQDITALATKINELIKKYDPLKVVMDTGGLGKKIAHEINKRYSSQLVAAEKDRKFEFIELLNDAMRTKRFFAKKDSDFAHDCMLVEWDKDVHQKLKISDRYHSDICDAVLYAYRECLHWLTEPEKPKLVPNTPQWSEAEEEEMVRIAMKQSGNQRNEWDDQGFY